MEKVTLLHGDNKDWLLTLDDASIDAIVTDPPYGIRWDNQHWDYDLPEISQLQQCLRVLKPGAFALFFSGRNTHHRLGVRIEDAGFLIHDTIIWAYGQGFTNGKSLEDGVNTQLKPSLEIIIVARKPLDGTATENFKKWGTGGFFIRAVREGRYPTNLILEDTPEMSELFPKTKKNGSITKPIKDTSILRGNYKTKPVFQSYGDDGSAIRYFSRIQFCSKPKGEEKIDHPTQKPLELMTHLVSLVTPEDGVVLDPWMGSGTTAVATMLKGYNFIGIERELKYITITNERLKWYD